MKFSTVCIVLALALSACALKSKDELDNTQKVGISVCLGGSCDGEDCQKFNLDADTCAETNQGLTGFNSMKIRCEESSENCFALRIFTDAACEEGNMVVHSALECNTCRASENHHKKEGSHHHKTTCFKDHVEVKHLCGDDCSKCDQNWNIPIGKCTKVAAQHFHTKHDLYFLVDAIRPCGNVVREDMFTSADCTGQAHRTTLPAEMCHGFRNVGTFFSCPVAGKDGSDDGLDSELKDDSLWASKRHFKSLEQPPLRASHRHSHNELIAFLDKVVGQREV